MKTLNEIKLSLSIQKTMLLKKYKVNRLGIFGSYVRGEQQQDSDLDVLIDYEDPPSLVTLIELEYYLSEVIGVKVDLVTTKGIKPQLKDYILKEVVYI
jgi:predicted nucleotidyltransferase